MLITRFELKFRHRERSERPTMAKSNNPEPSNFRKYGVPFYAVAWVPYKSIRFDFKSEEDQKEDQPDRNDDRNYVVLAGGGGEGRSGIPNAVVLSEFDLASNSLSDLPVVKHGTGSDLPYRMAGHPRGEGLICSFPKFCRWFEWDGERSSEGHKLGIKQSEKELNLLQDVEQQLALEFNDEGSVLASGGENGNLKVFKWPSMEIILNEAQAHASVKDLDFSPDGKLLVSLGNGGCRVWDVTSSKAVASLPKGNDEIFCSCRFSQTNEKNLVLYTVSVTGKGGSIATWNTTTWKRISSKSVVRDTILAFDVSADGKFLACGTTEGDVMIINSTSMRTHQVIKKAHLGFVTALRFSPDSSAFASASLDSSARVTIIQEAKENREISLWLIILIFLIAIAAYFFKNPQILESFTKI
ncbi:SEC12-like protein 2 isoform X1 [Morus notabilis]|uniref:SEC12-like protein 2 isoform X1 n=1 Tax=Morus notabilis TaxID=981085 RepID=UPI000CED1635|nr:SEC12-like protein 2 isoform X1 [Morus notabilis]